MTRNAPLPWSFVILALLKLILQILLTWALQHFFQEIRTSSQRRFTKWLLTVESNPISDTKASGKGRKPILFLGEINPGAEGEKNCVFERTGFRWKKNIQEKNNIYWGKKTKNAKKNMFFPQPWPVRYFSSVWPRRGRRIKREQKIQQPRCFRFNCSKTAMGDGRGGGGGGDNKKRQTEFPNMFFGGCLSSAGWKRQLGPKPPYRSCDEKQEKLPNTAVHSKKLKNDTVRRENIIKWEKKIGQRPGRYFLFSIFFTFAKYNKSWERNQSFYCFFTSKFLHLMFFPQMRWQSCSGRIFLFQLIPLFIWRVGSAGSMSCGQSTLTRLRCFSANKHVHCGCSRV